MCAPILEGEKEVVYDLSREKENGEGRIAVYTVWKELEKLFLRSFNVSGAVSDCRWVGYDGFEGSWSEEICALPSA